MLAAGWILAIVLAVVLTLWFSFTVTRLDRLHARLDARWAALDAQLVRRAAVVSHLAEQDVLATADVGADLSVLLHSALDTDGDPARRVQVENTVGRVARLLSGVVATPGPEELYEVTTRVMIARRFYNDAVRDTRGLRARRLPRLLRLAGRRAMPEFFDIDDTPTPRPQPIPWDAPGSLYRPTDRDLRLEDVDTEQDRA